MVPRGVSGKGVWSDPPPQEEDPQEADPPVNRMTDMCNNITSANLLRNAVGNNNHDHPPKTTIPSLIAPLFQIYTWTVSYDQNKILLGTMWLSLCDRIPGRKIIIH